MACRANTSPGERSLRASQQMRCAAACVAHACAPACIATRAAQQAARMPRCCRRPSRVGMQALAAAQLRPSSDAVKDSAGGDPLTRAKLVTRLAALQRETATSVSGRTRSLVEHCFAARALPHTVPDSNGTGGVSGSQHTTGHRTAVDAAQIHGCGAGVCVGSGMAGVAQIAEAGRLVLGGKARRVTPYFVPSVLNNMAAGASSTPFLGM